MQVRLASMHKQNCPVRPPDARQAWWHPNGRRLARIPVAPSLSLLLSPTDENLALPYAFIKIGKSPQSKRARSHTKNTARHLLIRCFTAAVPVQRTHQRLSEAPAWRLRKDTAPVRLWAVTLHGQ